MTEINYIREKAHDDLIKLQQLDQKHKFSETNLQVAQKEIYQLKEENARFSSQVKILTQEIRRSEKEAKKALLALHKWDRVARSCRKRRRLK